MKLLLLPLGFLRNLFAIFWPLLFGLLWCEYLVYFAAFGYWCSYPADKEGISNNVKTMVLSDIHLLGERNGHWFDKLRREWQMYRSFQTAITMFNPELVIILGDLFDEGEYSTPEQFKTYTDRFAELFEICDETKLITVVGNHDIGFHKRMIAFDPFLRVRFEKTYNVSLVDLIRYKGINFVSLNSMALEGDDCHLCHQAETLVKRMGKKLENSCDTTADEKCDFSAPILVMHFPLYRKSHAVCSGPDAAFGEEREMEFLEKIDCLSEESSNLILESIKPRLVLTGHSHYGCDVDHNSVPEWGLASFSWRNIANPTFLLMHINSNEFQIEKCCIPNENSIITAYCIFVLLFFLNMYFRFHVDEIDWKKSS